MKQSIPEQAFLLLVREAGLPEPTAEYTFHKNRKWRFDFSWIPERVAVEIEGGIYVNGRHNRASGYEKDCEKYNMAAIDGWCVIRLTPSMINFTWIERLKALILKRNMDCKRITRIFDNSNRNHYNE